MSDEQNPPQRTHICTVCHSICSPWSGFGTVLGGFAIGLAIFIALGTSNGNVALTATPIAIAGLAGVLRGGPSCPFCGARAIVPLTTRRGQALLREAQRDRETGT